MLGWSSEQHGHMKVSLIEKPLCVTDSSALLSKYTKYNLTTDFRGRNVSLRLEDFKKLKLREEAVTTCDV